MKHEIDLFGPYPDDFRWDINKNAKILNIVFHAGCFGNFFKFFIDKFSKLSPDLPGEPFTDIGTSHSLDNIKFSGLFQKYHGSFINDNEGETKLPVCLILPTKKKHYLYLKQAQLFRAGDHKVSPDDLWKKAVGEMPKRLKASAQDIKDLYDIQETAHFHWLPKFLVRDWYKLEFLQRLEDTNDYQWFQALKTHPFFKKQKTYQLDLESFFYWETFLENITELDDVFGLDLDFDRKEDMKRIFDNGLDLDFIRQECNITDHVFNDQADIEFKDLNVATEAFIYAEMEKRNKFILMPLTNRFFRDSAEIYQFIEHYPNYYKAMNPNMPEFNGKPNPYYLKKDK